MALKIGSFAGVKPPNGFTRFVAQKGCKRFDKHLLFESQGENTWGKQLFEKTIVREIS